MDPRRALILLTLWVLSSNYRCYNQRSIESDSKTATADNEDYYYDYYDPPPVKTAPTRTGLADICHVTSLLQIACMR